MQAARDVPARHQRSCSGAHERASRHCHPPPSPSAATAVLLPGETSPWHSGEDRFAHTSQGRWDAEAECSEPALRRDDRPDSPLALRADELQGEEPVICLWVQDNQRCFHRGRAHAQRVALEKSLKKRGCCGVPRLGEKGSQQSQAETDCTGIGCSCGSSLPSSGGTRGMERTLAPRTLVFSFISALGTCLDSTGHLEQPACLASPPAQSLASLHTSNASTIPKPPASKAGRAPAGNQTFLWWRLTPGAPQHAGHMPAQRPQKGLC